jgi:hypothetical protein
MGQISSCFNTYSITQVSEKVVFGDPEITTGASNDLQQVTWNHLNDLNVRQPIVVYQGLECGLGCGGTRSNVQSRSIGDLGGYFVQLYLFGCPVAFHLALAHYDDGWG